MERTFGTVLHLKGPFLHSVIFKTGKNGYYDKATTIYRDIAFRYADVVKMEGQPISRAFKDRELAKWLHKNNNVFINYYTGDRRTTNNSNRIKNTINNIKPKIANLIRLGLLSKVDEVKQSKGTGMVTRYQFGPFTYLLLSIVRSSNPEPEESAKWIEHAYNIYQIILTAEDAPKISIFHSRLFKKFKDRGLFSDFVINLLAETLLSDTQMRHVQDLVYRIVSKTDDLEQVKLFHSLRNETLNEMYPHEREPVLLLLKSDIERNTMLRVRSRRVYEEVLLRSSKESPETLAVEGYCKGCRVSVGALVDTVEYLDAILYLPDEPIKKPCPTCNKDSLLIPKIYP
jgi:hypothetical protein